MAAVLLHHKVLVPIEHIPTPRGTRSPWLELFLGVAMGVAMLCPLRAAESVTLVWDPNVELDLAGYRLYYGTNSRSYDQSIDVGNSTTNIVDTLQAGTTYYFAVVAYNTAGLESDYSNEVSYTPTNSPTGGTTPTIYVVNYYQSSVVLSWVSAPGQTYRVLYKDQLEDPVWQSGSDPITASDSLTSWTDTRLGAGAQRFYAVVLLAP